MIRMFSDIYKGKKIIITGHTGFKGTWLSTWLISLGADVVGISKDIPTSPSMFIELDLKISIKPLKKHWEVCEEIATLFLKNNMSSLDKFFYNEIKNGLLD